MGHAKKPANANPMTTARFGKLGVENNSRTVKRYAMPATASGMMNAGPPMSLELREQIVSETSKMTPSP